MDLTDAQKSTIATWIKEGKSLADVQHMLREEFDISMTYMDVRFLIDDLNIVFAEPEPESMGQGETQSAALEGDTKGQAAEKPEPIDEGGTGGVSVDVDKVMRPGALVSGNVTFSDGKTLAWQLTSSGQLGLMPGDDPDYRPRPEDVQEFQIQLEALLRKQGF